MKCCYCGSGIGFWRLARDREFCSDSHRRAMAARSARVAREDERFYTWDDPWVPLQSMPVTPREVQAKRQKDSTSVALVTMLLLLVIAAGATGYLPEPITIRKMGLSAFGELHAAQSPITNWESIPLARGSALLLWPETKGLSNYRFSFTAVLGAKPVSWAVRAWDAKNYCALRLFRSPDGYRLERTPVIGGIEQRKSISPPIPGLTENARVSVRVDAQANSVVTSVNGQPIDSWSDPRLRSGGAGWLTPHGNELKVESADVVLLAKNLPESAAY